MRRIHGAAVIGAFLFLGAFAGTSAKADVDVSLPFATGGAGAPVCDVAYAADGTLVAAWAESFPNFPDKLVVASSADGGLTWNLLSRSHYYFSQIAELSLDLASGFTGNKFDKRAYVGVHFIDHNEPKSPDPQLEWVALVSGPYDQSWNGPGRIALTNDPNFGQPAVLNAPWHPSTAVIPLGSSEYAVGIAFAYPEARANGASILTVFSIDHGRSFAPGQVIRIAGPGSSALQGTGVSSFQASAYAHPSMVASSEAPEMAIAFEDRDLSIVHVVWAVPRSFVPNGGRMNYAFGTPQGDKRREHHPEMAIADDGKIDLTCLVGEADASGAFGLTCFFGEPGAPALGLLELQQIHAQAMSPGHIRIRDGKAFVTARCVVDGGTRPATGIFSFKGDRKQSGAWAGGAINDVPDQGVSPRIAVTPHAVMAKKETVGYIGLDRGSSFEQVLVDR